jgi:hypothetical protein
MDKKVSTLVQEIYVKLIWKITKLSCFLRIEFSKNSKSNISLNPCNNAFYSIQVNVLQLCKSLLMRRNWLRLPTDPKLIDYLYSEFLNACCIVLKLGETLSKLLFGLMW